MSLLDLLSQKDIWLEFYEYKRSVVCAETFLSSLRRFINEEKYLPVCETIFEKKPFPLPKKSVISKLGTDKKRTVYTYPDDENMVLKLLTRLMIRKYDASFAPNLYSFRPARTAKDAVRRILKSSGSEHKFVYKADIHDYFNSIPVDKLLPKLAVILDGDKKLIDFLTSLLCEERVISKGKIVTESKGIMAGTPISAFLADLYLSELDFHFYDLGALYIRYSDDIIVFAETEAELEDYIAFIKGRLELLSLEMNPKKEKRSSPGEPFVFLGFEISPGKVDISPAGKRKLKGKMRRKRDALARWSKRNDISGEKAAKAFIRIFNRKLFINSGDNELCWSEWFFPVINTVESLREIDLYAQDCIRYLISGKHTKSRFNVRYEDIKKLGYRSLVHEYYRKGKVYENRTNNNPQ